MRTIEGSTEEINFPVRFHGFLKQRHVVAEVGIHGLDFDGADLGLDVDGFEDESGGDQATGGILSLIVIRGVKQDMHDMFRSGTILSDGLLSAKCMFKSGMILMGGLVSTRVLSHATWARVKIKNT